jgi:folate-binding protein YgfZ
MMQAASYVRRPLSDVTITEKLMTNMQSSAALATSEQTALLFERSDAGLLVLTDADRSDFLQRMTTNNIKALRPGQAAVTVLTSPTARITFVFTVLCLTDELWLLPAPGEAAALSRHLRGQIFFMDKVKVRDASSEFVRSRLFGPTAAAVLAQLGFDPDLPPNRWQNNAGITVLHQSEYDLPGFELIVPADQHATMTAQLREYGSTPLTDLAEYETRRIELGRPAVGHELTPDYTPLEAGLAWACAENKGCYTGQEIIARQITYDKVTKTLIGLMAQQPLTAGASVQLDGQTIGTITSATVSPRLNSPIALAIVRRPHNQPGVKVTVGEIEAEVVALPFVPA